MAKYAWRCCQLRFINLYQHIEIPLQTVMMIRATGYYIWFLLKNSEEEAFIEGIEGLTELDIKSGDESVLEKNLK